MSQESSEPRVYSPSQAAKKLGISTAKLKYHRLRGDIEGTDIGNTTLYSEAQLKAANLMPKKPGPKGPRKKGDEGEQELRDVSTTKRVSCKENA
jgi:hypothetical protein